MPLLYVERLRIPNSDMKTVILFFSAVHFILLLHTDVIHVEYAGESADYVVEGKSECHFMNGTQRVKVLAKYFYNQEEFLYYDSDVGYFIAKTDFERPDAEYFNKDKEHLEKLKTVVQRCIFNYNGIRSVTADRRVQPKVKISIMAQHEDADPELHILACNVYGFYPPEIEVNWYRNGQMESTEVESTDVFHNGDWTYQVIVNLQTEIKKGDNFSCEVTHSSLQTPVRVDWQPQISDSAKNKVVTGVVGFVLGSILIIAGVVVYVRGRKAQMKFQEPQSEPQIKFQRPQSEHFIHT